MHEFVFDNAAEVVEVVVTMWVVPGGPEAALDAAVGVVVCFRVGGAVGLTGEDALDTNTLNSRRNLSPRQFDNRNRLLQPLVRCYRPSTRWGDVELNKLDDILCEGA